MSLHQFETVFALSHLANRLATALMAIAAMSSRASVNNLFEEAVDASIRESKIDPDRITVIAET